MQEDQKHANMQLIDRPRQRVTIHDYTIKLCATVSTHKDDWDIFGLIITLLWY